LRSRNRASIWGSGSRPRTGVSAATTTKSPSGEIPSTRAMSQSMPSVADPPANSASTSTDRWTCWAIISSPDAPRYAVVSASA